MIRRCDTSTKYCALHGSTLKIIGTYEAALRVLLCYHIAMMRWLPATELNSIQSHTIRFCTFDDSNTFFLTLFYCENECVHRSPFYQRCIFPDFLFTPPPPSQHQMNWRRNKRRRMDKLRNPHTTQSKAQHSSFSPQIVKPNIASLCFSLFGWLCFLVIKSNNKLIFHKYEFNKLVFGQIYY